MKTTKFKIGDTVRTNERNVLVVTSIDGERCTGSLVKNSRGENAEQLVARGIYRSLAAVPLFFFFSDDVTAIVSVK